MLRRSLQIRSDGLIPTIRLIHHCLVYRPSNSIPRLCVEPLDRLQIDTRIDLKTQLLHVRSAGTLWHQHIVDAYYTDYGLLYLLDDNFYLLNGWDALSLYYQEPTVRRSLNYFLFASQAVYCHHQHFRNFLLPFNPNVTVLPTFFDFSLVESTGSTDRASGEFRIGLVLNSSKAKDVEFLLPALLKLLQVTGEHVVVEFFGYLPDGISLGDRVRHFPEVSDYASFISAKQRRAWNLGLAPLGESEFASYKTENKYREFGGLGIPAIYSDVEPYRSVVENGKTGWLLPNSTDAWLQLLVKLCQNPESCREVGQQASSAVRDKYDLNTVATAWQQELSKRVEQTRRQQYSSQLKRLRLACLKLIYRLRHPLTNSNTVLVHGKNGWHTARPLLGLDTGLYSHQVCVEALPGERLTCNRKAPPAMEYIWVVQALTFGQSVDGVFTLTILNTEGLVLLQKEWHRLQDGEVLKLCLRDNHSSQLQFMFENASSSRVALLLVSPEGTTGFALNGVSLRGSFVT